MPKMTKEQQELLAAGVPSDALLAVMVKSEDAATAIPALTPPPPALLSNHPRKK